LSDSLVGQTQKQNDKRQMTDSDHGSSWIQLYRNLSSLAHIASHRRDP
jgi:hypothetical protein